MACPPTACILLLAQPRLLGHVFNPVAFWLATIHLATCAP